MLGLTARRAICSRSKCLPPSAFPARAVTRTQQWHSANPRNRAFHSTPSNAAFRPTWMPMRVKTPWIDALMQSRQEAGNAGKAGEQGAPSFEPDLTPKKMSDSYYSAVCLNTHFEDDCTDYWDRFCLWRKISGCLTITSMLRVTSVLVRCLWTWMLLRESLRIDILVMVLALLLLPWTGLLLSIPSWRSAISSLAGKSLMPRDDRAWRCRARCPRSVRKDKRPRRRMS